MIKEDGAEKTKQLFVGATVLVVGIWVLWQWWFGQGLFEGKALVQGEYGSGATEMVQLIVFLVMQVGALSLGLFRTGTDLLKTLGSFFFQSDDENDGQKVTIDVLSSVKGNALQTSPSKLKVEPVDGPLFRTDNSGVLFRDVLLEKQLSEPQTAEELTADAVDALMSGDVERLNKRVHQLHPDKVKEQNLEVEVKVDEQKTKQA
jgi:hypothetical protein